MPRLLSGFVIKRLIMIGRASELKQIQTLLTLGRHVLLEGPVGVGKTTLALEVANALHKKTYRIDGDGRYTEQKLVGSFDPKIVMESGFTRDGFLPGPLMLAMEEGAMLLINELNRMPEMVQNVLLPALDEGKIQIPLLGEIKAKPGFVVVATQNPREFVATSQLSEALLDRLEWIPILAMSEEEELKIVRAHLKNQSTASKIPLEACVEIVRLTRAHPKIKRGASLRAAIAMAQILEFEFGQKTAPKSDAALDAVFDAVAMQVLANRIELQVGKFSNRPYHELITEVIQDLKLQLKKK